MAYTDSKRQEVSGGRNIQQECEGGRRGTGLRAPFASRPDHKALRLPRQEGGPFHVGLVVSV